mgnify:CR=1 FL=1|tara:strand:+ start:70 stop:267 length:198 start_codon:yes stop_codon:yes gene_type:complete
MLEFLFGFFLGVWAGQALPLPSVGIYLQSFWVPKIEQVKPVNNEEEEEVIPLFSGNMPTSQLPTV